MKAKKLGIFNPIVFLLVLNTLILVSCTGAPIKELNEARSALKDAMNAGAPICAINEFSNAEESFLKANNETAFRNYDQAKVDAINSRELALLAKKITESKPYCHASYQESTTKTETYDESSSTAGEDESSKTQAEVIVEKVNVILTADQMERVLFRFDDFELTEEGKASLDKDADFLLANPNVNVIIEGHADKRGTNEYNLSLGLRRAKSVVNYLVNSGVELNKMQIVSYGEERPSVYGNNESAYSKNRRVEFKENYSS